MSRCSARSDQAKSGDGRLKIVIYEPVAAFENDLVGDYLPPTSGGAIKG